MLKSVIPKYVTTEVSDTYPADRSTRMSIQVAKKSPKHRKIWLKTKKIPLALQLASMSDSKRHYLLVTINRNLGKKTLKQRKIMLMKSWTGRNLKYSWYRTTGLRSFPEHSIILTHNLIVPHLLCSLNCWRNPHPHSKKVGSDHKCWSVGSNEIPSS